MPSPFPGMDPYLEASGRWPGFHNAFITHVSEWLNEFLPENYFASIDERVQLVNVGEGYNPQVLPDVTVGAARSGGVPGPGGRPAPQPPGTTATVEPETRTLPGHVELREAFVDIIALPTHELVTSIELLSPTNKTGVGRGQYLAKRRALLRRGVNLVEIDLLVLGERLEMVEPLPRGDYYALVSRSNRRPLCDVYAWGVRQPLPSIPVLLQTPDPDVSLDLAAIVSLTYNRGRYARSLPFDEPLGVALSPEDAAWAAERASAASGPGPAAGRAR